MLHLLRAFHGDNEIESLFSGLSSHVKEQLVTGLTGSSRTIMLAAMYKETKRSQVVVTYNLLQAQKLYEDLVSIIGEEHVWLYPVNELIASEISVASPELKAQRLEVLNFLCTDKSGIVIVPIAGLRRFLPAKKAWKESQLSLSIGDEIEVNSLLHCLVEMGYERREMVEAPGTFSIRGGIIDIYPLTVALPIRMELFDSEIDSIRSFTIEDQRSQEKLSYVEIGPAAEYILSERERERGLGYLQQKLAYSVQQAKYTKQKEALAENIGYEIAKLKNGQQIEQVFKYLSLFYEKPASLLDYLSDDAIVIVDEISRVSETAEQLMKEEAEWYTSLLESGEIVRDVSFSHDFIHLLHGSKRQIIYLSLFTRHVAHTHPQNIVHTTCKTMQEFYGQMHLFKAEIERWKKAKYTVLLLCANEERVKKLESILTDYEIEASVISSMDPLPPGKVGVMIGDLNAGFELPMQKLAVITEKELFKKKIKKQQRKQKLSNAERIKSYSELKVGDHVVHINHGIGKFLGIETLEINGIHKDYLHVKYQGNDKLYVPVEQIDQVQKYIGAEGKEPKVYKLGGTEWKKVRTKVERSVQDIADDLIKLYAEREAARGYAFSPDGAEQGEFESSFPYQETEDQLRSIEEIKKDMERERPMDRLLCGDVGYGKTEVAIRAAFKAVMDGKQVAILVPTTILAQQHYETIKERFQEFPLEIGLMNRFRTRKQQLETIQRLKEGTIDVVIGTHRLLSKDVTYKDLGLLIIDEEQRFGVTHKEKIKQLKTNIDVLTLTATPIPRTLHMSMLGVRDLSVIETPPENRFPVQTYVVEYNEVLVREAIERELARGGQVYFLYNRVEDIERKAEEIAALIPDARVTYAHGRMNENELESVIIDFLDRQSDVLVSTTIIETGVDIPNVNTLIVNEADRMGLSQLYQLRGRVGRSNRIAYSYFTYKKDKSLTEVAEKRLQAMKEFTELGSGFKIAMRDLSIRGAGNLLGAAQHGFIDSVGFDLYSQMLKDAIEERKGIIDEKQRRQVDFEMEVDAYIPETYISDSKQKVGMYKQFKDLHSIEELESLQEEMIDRFGDYPIEVGYLFQVSYIKLLARIEKLQSVKQVKDEITLLCSAEATSNLDVPKLFELVNTYGKAIGLGTDGSNLKLVIDKKSLATSEWLTMIENILKGLANAKKEGVKA